VPKPERAIDPTVLAAARIMPCAVCADPPPSDPSHIRSRGAGGPDAAFNVWPMCRYHHAEWHAVGAKEFLRAHASFAAKLIHVSWEWGVGEKLWHEELRRR
jgi:hypothetical protein